MSRTGRLERLLARIPGTSASQRRRQREALLAPPPGELKKLYDEVRETIEGGLRDGLTLEWICAGRDVRAIEESLGTEFLENGLPNRRHWGAWTDEVTLLLGDDERAHLVTRHWHEGLNPAELETYRALRKDGVERAPARELATLLTEGSSPNGDPG